MPYVQGESLRDHLQRERQLPLRTPLALPGTWRRRSGRTINGQSLAYLVSPLPVPALVNRRGEWRSLPNIPANLVFQSALVSPDGRMLVAQVGDLSADRQDIWTYPMPGGPPARLATVDDGFLWAPRWTQDGMTVRYASVRKNEEAICSIPRDGSRAPQLLLKRAGGFSWSIAHHPDGQAYRHHVVRYE